MQPCFYQILYLTESHSRDLDSKLHLLVGKMQNHVAGKQPKKKHEGWESRYGHLWECFSYARNNFSRLLPLVPYTSWTPSFWVFSRSFSDLPGLSYISSIFWLKVDNLLLEVSPNWHFEFHSHLIQFQPVFTSLLCIPYWLHSVLSSRAKYSALGWLVPL